MPLLKALGNDSRPHTRALDAPAYLVPLVTPVRRFGDVPVASEFWPPGEEELATAMGTRAWVKDTRLLTVSVSVTVPLPGGGPTDWSLGVAPLPTMPGRPCPKLSLSAELGQRLTL